jgi:hypothetical protein
MRDVVGFDREDEIMITLKKTITSALTLSVAATLSVSANAATITGLYDTGVDGVGNVLANGTVDSHYSITASTQPGFITPAPAYKTTYSAWTAGGTPTVGSPGSGWITPFIKADGTAKNGGSNGATYDYDLIFNIGVGILPSNVTLTGDVASDNFVRILINGVDVGGQAPVPFPGVVNYFRFYTPFGSSNNMVVGSNTLTFRVKQYEVVTGLRVNGLAAAVVPEPATWAMMLSGFFLVATQMRRRKRMTVVVA